MASFNKHKNGWRAQVYVAGKRASKVLPSKLEAKDWAVFKEQEMREGAILSIPFPDLLDLYDKRVSVNKLSHKWELKQFRKFRNIDLAGKLVSDITKADVSLWKDNRLAMVSGSTVNREMNLLSNIFTMAIEWEYCTVNPCKGVRRPKDNPSRDRRPTEEEIERLSFIAGFDGSEVTSQRQRIMAAFLFAIETAMRKSEILSLKANSVSGRVAHLPKTKNGTARNVPLSKRALELFELVGGDFKLSLNQIDGGWRIMCEKAAVVGLNFHDSRHEATTRLAQKLHVLDLARMTGHKDLKKLQIYYNATADEIADKLD
ncbi:site-specific integrase [Roseobacter sp. N2S]|uniref:tyrosine-type recombinase/integrase n=1 Tax=Roseobacter sp. N2S TaxID=2663844 RepID=UPI00285B825F|nr:site-specific integrase [Roseobacter sp. N2S]MDR6264215.1 integrase [Roseobacter sp. N2S]